MYILSASNLGNKVLFHISKWHHVFPVLLVSAAGEVRINRSCGSPDTEHASHFTITEEEDMDGFASISPCVRSYHETYGPRRGVTSPTSPLRPRQIHSIALSVALQRPLSTKKQSHVCLS